MEIDRNKADAPPVMMRVMTAERPEGITLPDDIPNYSGHSGRFMLRLMAAWAAMEFKSPKFPYRS